jgi:hypothetical protein
MCDLEKNKFDGGNWVKVRESQEKPGGAGDEGVREEIDLTIKIVHFLPDEWAKVT